MTIETERRILLLFLGNERRFFKRYPIQCDLTLLLINRWLRLVKKQLIPSEGIRSRLLRDRLLLYESQNWRKNEKANQKAKGFPEIRQASP